MPPDHGAALVRTVLGDDQLTKMWKQELVEMQQRMLGIRKLLSAELRTAYQSEQFDFIEHHKGMFTVLGFSPEQMIKLRENYGIYGVGDGRINIAGLVEKQIPYVAQAIATIAG
jgi:aspartate aminotransferase